MVEQSAILDLIFSSLSDPTRRDILSRVMHHGQSVSEIAAEYDFSLAAIAKHLQVLEHAGLVRKIRRGKQRIVTVDPAGLTAAKDYLETYHELWEQRLDNLTSYLNSIEED